MSTVTLLLISTGRIVVCCIALLVVLLEQLDSYADPEALDGAFRDFIAEYGAPSGGTERGA